MSQFFRYTVITAGPRRWVVIDEKRQHQAVFNGTYNDLDQAQENADQLNREYERWMRECVAARADEGVDL